MYATFVFAVIVIAILIVKRMVWDHYEPEVPGRIDELRRVDWTPAAINVFAWLSGIALVLAAVYARYDQSRSVAMVNRLLGTNF